MRAIFANPAGSDVLLALDDGTSWAVKPDDERLAGLTIEPYELPVPQEVTRAQARVAMAAHILPDGRSLLKATKALIEARLAAVETMPDSDPASIAAEQINEWWTSAATYRRDHPAMVEIAGQFGLTSAQMDDLFRAASQVTG